MAQDGIPSNGEAAALVRAGAGERRRGRLGAALAGRAQGRRPAACASGANGRAGKPFGRWLGDFLDQDTPSGLFRRRKSFCSRRRGASLACSRLARRGFGPAFEEWKQDGRAAAIRGAGFVAAMARFTAPRPKPCRRPLSRRPGMRWRSFSCRNIGSRRTRARSSASRPRSGPILRASRRRRTRRRPSSARRTARASTSLPLMCHRGADAEALSAAEAQRRNAERPDAPRSARPFPRDAREDDAQPRVLREFFDELVREARRAPANGETFFAQAQGEP